MKSPMLLNFKTLLVVTAVLLTGLGGCSSTKKWTHPSALSDYISLIGWKVYDGPVVAMNNRGEAIIVWTQADGAGINRVFKSEYRNGKWTHPEDSSDALSPADTEASMPEVAISDNGDSLIVWKQNNLEPFSQIFKSEKRDGVWTKPSSIDDNISPDSENADYPSVAMDGEGNSIIVWHQQNAGKYAIYKVEYREESWGSASIICPGGYDALYPVVSMNNSGNAIIAWQQKDTSDNSQIFASTFNGSMWTAVSSVDDDHLSVSVTSAFNPAVAIDPAGNAITVWTQHNATTNRVLKSEFDGSQWDKPSDVDDDAISPEGNYSYAPQAVMSSESILVAWVQSDGTYNQVFIATRNDGIWSTPDDLDDNISPDGSTACFCTGYPSLATDKDSSFLIAWPQYEGPTPPGDKEQIFLSEYKDGEWYYPEGLSDNISPDGYDAVQQDAAMDEDGNAIIVWKQNNGSDDQVYMSEFR